MAAFNRRKAMRIIIIILIILGIFLLLRLSVYCIPFIIAFILSSLIEPLVNFLEKKVRIPRKVGAVFNTAGIIHSRYHPWPDNYKAGEGDYKCLRTDKRDFRRHAAFL